MIRQCEFEVRYDPDLDMYVTKHIYDKSMTNIYGEGISDVFKAVGRKIFGRTAKSAATKAAKSAATKTGEYAGKKAGDKIVELLSKNKTTTPSVLIEPNISPSEPNISPSEPKVLTDQEVYQRVNQMLSGGKLRRRNFYLNI